MAEEEFDFEGLEDFDEFEDLEAESQATDQAADQEDDLGLEFEDEFDRLRQKTARTSAVYDEMDLEDELEAEESGGFFSQISPGQRLILLVLLLLDIVVIAVGFMAVFGVI